MVLAKVILFVITATICVLVLIVGNRIHNYQAELYRPIDYLENSQENIDPWRWRKPNITLRIPYDGNSHLGVKNAPGVSSFIFPEKFRFSYFIAHLVGVFLIGIDLLVFLGSCQIGTITGADFLARLSLYLFLLSLGLFFQQVGGLVLQIDLYPDRIGIVTQYAFSLHRTTIYKRDHLLSVKGKIQSFWTMERGQIQPDYKITIRRSFLGYFQVNKTFSLPCNQTTGSWVVGGLNYWKSVSISHL